MMFPFADTESDDITEEEYVPKEYGIDFKTGQLSGKIVEGVDALMVWCWIALHTPRYRYYIYSDEYGQEFEDLIGKQYSEGYTNSELERMTEECLCVNPYIEGINQLSIYHQRLGSTEKYLTVIQIIKEMPEDKKTESFQNLIDAILNDNREIISHEK